MMEWLLIEYNVLNIALNYMIQAVLYCILQYIITLKCDIKEYSIINYDTVHHNIQYYTLYFLYTTLYSIAQ